MKPFKRVMIELIDSMILNGIYLFRNGEYLYVLTSQGIKRVYELDVQEVTVK